MKLFDDNVMDLLLMVAQHANERPFRNLTPLLLDIFYEVRPLLANTRQCGP